MAVSHGLGAHLDASYDMPGIDWLGSLSGPTQGDQGGFSKLATTSLGVSKRTDLTSSAKFWVTQDMGYLGVLRGLKSGEPPAPDPRLGV